MEKFTKSKVTKVHIKQINIINNPKQGTNIVSEYDQEIPQSQTADHPVAL